jgi:hypothetical protein
MSTVFFFFFVAEQTFSVNERKAKEKEKGDTRMEGPVSKETAEQLEAPGYAIKIIVGNANRKLGQDIAAHLRVPLAKCEVGTFSDGETKIQIEHNIRGTDCYVIQPTCHNYENGTSVNDNLMELCAGRLAFSSCSFMYSQFVVTSYTQTLFCPSYYRSGYVPLFSLHKCQQSCSALLWLCKTRSQDETTCANFCISSGTVD